MFVLTTSTHKRFLIGLWFARNFLSFWHIKMPLCILMHLDPNAFQIISHFLLFAKSAYLQFLLLLLRLEQLPREFLSGSTTQILLETPPQTLSLFHASTSLTGESMLETSLHSKSFSSSLPELRTSLSPW